MLHDIGKLAISDLILKNPRVWIVAAIPIQILFCQMHPQFYKGIGQPGRDSSRLDSLQYSYEGFEDSLYAGEAHL
jgi:hypothetical protein